MALLHTDADCPLTGARRSTFRWSVQRIVENSLQGRGSGRWRSASRSCSTRRLTPVRFQAESSATLPQLSELPVIRPNALAGAIVVMLRQNGHLASILAWG